MLKIAYQYLHYYKSQTFAILASIILTSALLSGMSSLMYSNTCNDLEHKKTVYGNWHYYIAMETKLPSISSQKENGFHIIQHGKAELMDKIKEPYPISFLYTDETCREMLHREITEGTYPEKANEIAMDHYTLGNLGYSGQIGSTIHLGKKDYILTGIIQSAWAGNDNEMEVFVSEHFSKTTHTFLSYLQFNEKKPLYKQLYAFLKQYKISSDAVSGNDEVISYLHGEKPDGIYHILKFALTDPHGNFTYIILKLQSEYRLSFYGMILLLYFFSLFVIYSIFNISISKRLSEYAIMQTLGISEISITITLILELWLLLFIGYPLGCFLGNGILTLFYQNLNAVFSIKSSSIEETQTALSGLEQTFAQQKTDVSVFHINYSAAILGFFFLFISLAMTAFLVVRTLRKHSLRQAISETHGNGHLIKKRKRKIYSQHHYNLADIVVRKFLFSNKKKTASIIISLSVGGCIFLCTTYLVENLKIHAQMSMKSEDGLGSDYKISLKSRKFTDMIPESVVNNIKKIPELSEVYAAKYLLGELIIQEKDLNWDEYFNEWNQDSYFQKYFGGICAKKEHGTYGIKYDIYGYEYGLLKQLQDFILEGNIPEQEWETENKIIAVANVDGQGNYDFYGKHPGDTILLRVPKNLNCSPEILKFQSAEKYYIEKEFEIAAIISRTLLSEHNFLAIEPWNHAPSFIMTDKQMNNYYGLQGYRLLNASSHKNNNENTSNALLYEIRDIPKAVLQDYTKEIKTQENYLHQQQIFFSGIAVILLLISLFHIMNSMNYSILSHRREYGIIRAMGITDIGFYKMIVKAGLLYGIMTDIFIFLFYHLILRRWMDYYMAHIVQFLHINTGVPNKLMAVIMILNLLIAIIAVFIPAKRLVTSSIIHEISK